MNKIHMIVAKKQLNYTFKGWEKHESEFVRSVE